MHTFRIGTEHEAFVRHPNSKKQQCLKTIAKMITECGKNRRPTFDDITQALEKMALDAYPNYDKIQEVLKSDGT